MSLPKYAVRAALIWLVPIVLLICRSTLWLPIVLSIGLTLVESPGVRKRIFGSKSRKQLPCLKVPVLIRLAILWIVQVWCFVLMRTGDASDADSLSLEGVDAPSDRLRTMSVVLPCAGEGEYAFKTVRSVFDSTPTDILKEIVVVDDGSDPPLSETVLNKDVRDKYRVKLLRHESTVGLIGSKKDGGDAATGDIIVFFDCHVAPQRGWYSAFIRLINDNRRRIVVPMITDLNVDTWRQRSFSHGVSKCYLTWDADFKWFQSDDPYVPVLSGGLLGMSKQWWRESGGYDEQMRSWGGENIDQSLRTWLCGGEIVIARESSVAHMWRRMDDERTHAHYSVEARAATKNRLRAAVAWYGEFAEKLLDYPSLKAGAKDNNGNPWFGDLTNILKIKDDLGCHDFGWFLHRFSDVYELGGLVPNETFQLRVAGGSKCIAFKGGAGTANTGRGTAKLEDCDPQSDRQRWHVANRDPSKAGAPCCSGLRAWNTDQCMTKVSGGHILTYICDISGKTSDQFWDMTPQGQLFLRKAGFLQASCLQVASDGLEVAKCKPKDAPPTWIKGDPVAPIESRLFAKYLDEAKTSKEATDE
mmetsp:Transcript_40735/g.93740  ORF Transcript_40735/g.93740 Transcript_40735/m.93740 type:complete len:585 (-) Transcript_40735:54-1808(-)